VTVVAGSSASTQIGGAGTNSVSLRALDNAGNISSLVSLPVNIDLTSPTVTVSASRSFFRPDDRRITFTVSGTITDDLSGVNPGTAAFTVTDEDGRIQRSGPVTLGRGGSYSFTVSLRASRDGEDRDRRRYKITVSAKDFAGNLGSAATTVIVPRGPGH